MTESRSGLLGRLPFRAGALAAGLAYPLVFGPLGGVLAVAVQRSRARNSPHGSKP
jgi:hypothetical protein